ncbi:ABC transporter ATP-binding protein [Mesorhizobium sp. L-8-10]|uniref:ABC transporter ATP-binding protein n=1 Tax=unclassified Mesorhizobium TaxID=325217 RepID=UPI0019296411|nr:MULTISPECIES: ABC transporter ATP-binding protein [unclassified Mesorhizobium]BCH23408.1 ABC transporter ATP-binding protein [Mesorhizobium sp. L-8-3]BCH31179.1 ABC transporter ATP-binding protein [Mesorhizobium sp. L-8-10]
MVAAPELLRVENLRTYFHSSGSATRAVDGVSLSIGAGRILGVVGESGSGKSVTGASIMGLIQHPGRIEPGSRILFRGRDLATEDERSLRELRGNEIAMIFQEPMTSLNPVLTAGAQIAENIRLHRRVGRREVRDRAIELMRLVGIPSPERRVDDYPHQLSGGMRQRIMIAMALACDPALLIADEPTTALDVTIQAQILDLILRLREELGMAVMFITHDFGVVAEICDDVVVMYGGQVVEEGPVAAVMTEPRHPYTRGLMDCIPRLGMRRDERLNSIPGIVPSPKAWPRGCRFANRCQHALDRCVTEAPPHFVVGAQRAACWLAEARQAAAPARIGGADA